MTDAADVRRWCLETALARHPADDGAALSAAKDFLRFLTAGEISPTIGEGAAELSSRDAGARPAQPHPSDMANLPAVAAEASCSRRERNAESTGASASDGAPRTAAGKVRQRAPARTDLPLSAGEAKILEALLRAEPPGSPIPEAIARQATGIQLAGPALSRLSALCRKGYLSNAIGVGGRVYRVTKTGDGERVRALLDGSRIEIRDDQPVPVTICPPRYAHGSVESQYQR